MASTSQPQSAGGHAPSLFGRLARQIFRRARVPLRVVLGNGEEITTLPGQPIACVRIRDRWTVLQLLAGNDLAFGDAYSDGRIEVEGDLVQFLVAVFRKQASAGPHGNRGSWLPPWLAWPRVNSLTGSRGNVSHHYDVGNDFYRLWLDDQLVYTCAYFPDPALTLEAAQTAKMDHVCRKLQLRPGQTVIEAGCGWGALARHMARHYGVTVRAFNLSHEQVEYARARAKAEGLDRQVQFVEDDYRNISGECDAFVSVGMLEHVGVSYYRDLGGVIHRCLKPNGLGLIHSIGRNWLFPTSAWIERRIFPGAYIPILREIMGIFEPWNFSVLDVENLRLHYARTLAHWLARFDQAVGRVRDMFDDRFVRSWRLYLASSLAAFSTGWNQLFQILFAHAANNDIPWTRGHVYEQPSGSRSAC